MRWT